MQREQQKWMEEQSQQMIDAAAAMYKASKTENNPLCNQKGADLLPGKHPQIPGMPPQGMIRPPVGTADMPQGFGPMMGFMPPMMGPRMPMMPMPPPKDK